jgi:HemY protein
MIRFIIIVALFFAVLAFSPLLLEEPGYILISLGDNIYELTVYAAIFWLTATFIILFIINKLIRGSFRVSFKAWNKVAFASRRKGIANFNKGLAAYMLEDYKTAEELFAKSADPSKRQQSAYLLAAAASAKQELDVNTDHYLNLLAKEAVKATKSDLISVIVKVKLLMSQKKDEAYQKARLLIDEHHKQVGHDHRLLSLEIDLCLIEKRYEAAISYLAAARKEKSISDDTIHQWESTAYYGAFNDIIRTKDKQDLETFWKNLSRKVKHYDTVLFAYCQVLAENDISEPLTKLITPALKKQPDANFLKQLRTLPIKQSEPLIATVQKHLHNNAKNAQWLSCLGHLAVMSEQWPMAEKAFGSLIKLEANQQKRQYDKQDLQAFAKALTEEGQHKVANEVWQKISTLD